MNKLTFTQNPILIKEFSLSKIKNWDEIEIAKTQFVTDNNIQLTRFPGFSFSSQEKADFYFDNYCTNVYKFHRDEETGDVSSICREIEIVKQISPNIIPVFLGNYPEYEKIIDVLKLNSYKKIWHPAYLTRNYSIEKMKEWKRRFLEQ